MDHVSINISTLCLTIQDVENFFPSHRTFIQTTDKMISIMFSHASCLSLLLHQAWSPCVLVLQYLSHVGPSTRVLLSVYSHLETVWLKQKRTQTRKILMQFAGVCICVCMCLLVTVFGFQQHFLLIHFVSVTLLRVSYLFQSHLLSHELALQRTTMSVNHFRS